MDVFILNSYEYENFDKLHLLKFVRKKMISSFKHTHIFTFQVTDEGVSTLSACNVFYYPVDHFKDNIAESYVANFRNAQNNEKTPSCASDDFSEVSACAVHPLKL